MLPSLIRTLVPMLVGYLATLSIFDDTDGMMLTTFVTVVISFGYYVIVRLLEHYVSASFGTLLGSSSAPIYTKVD